MFEGNNRINTICRNNEIRRLLLSKENQHQTARLSSTTTQNSQNVGIGLITLSPIVFFSQAWQTLILTCH